MWRESAKRWQDRYETNQEAFKDLGLPWRAFAVGKVGEGKLDYDWSTNPKVLRDHYDRRSENGVQSHFERFAQHLDLEEFEKFVTEKLGYTALERELVARRSRSTNRDSRWSVAPGAWWVLQKPHTFRYHPWKYGLDPRDPDYWDKWKRRKGSPYRSDYWDDYYQQLSTHIPEGQRRVFEELAIRVGVSI